MRRIAIGRAIALAACFSGVALAAQAEDKFVFGGLLPLTGAASLFGPGMSAAVELAVKDINAAGGVRGAKAEAILADDACDANIAARTLDRLVTQGAKAIMGTGCSNVTLALLDKIQSSKVSMCSGANTAPQLTTAPSGGYFARTSISQLMQGPVMAQLPLQDGHTNVAILSRGDPFSEGLAGSTRATLESRGAKVAKYIVYDPAQTAFEAEVAAVAAAKPDAVVVVGRDERGSIFRLLIERGLGPAKVGWYTPGGITADFYKLVDPSNPGVLKGLKQTAPPKASTTSAFAQRLLAQNGGIKEFLFAAEQYDCAIITALGAEAAKSSDPAVYKDAIAGVTRGETQCKAYGECRDLLKSGKSIAYVGPTGPIYMSDAREPTRASIQVFEVDGTGVPQPTRLIQVG
ncbi:ABC transporter substrate-binding protein, partial [Vineibacter terrae]|uniref:ABC transporter substrate-binding protein n=1 Tax=Vineibacter terrae TaxID=2586908 RepID=UPI002E3199EA